jgi:hypothetical protein
MLISHLPTIMFLSSVLALMFTSFERISMYVRDKDDGLNGINAAALTGARELPHFLANHIFRAPLYGHQFSSVTTTQSPVCC